MPMGPSFEIMIKLSRLFIFVHILRGITCLEDAVVTINGKRSLHIVNEKFISINIDPSVLLSNLNFSTTTLNLLSHLYPSFIRFSGPTTNFIKFSKVETNSSNRFTEDANLIVTPSMWMSLNKWIMDANLTPVFALSDVERINGAWNPKSVLPLMEITDKMNYSCLWELGHGCSNKSLGQYVEDVISLRHILDAFPGSRDVWGTVGTDFSGCLPSEHTETVRKLFSDVEDSLDAINWSPKFYSTETFPEKDMVTKAMSVASRYRLPVWTMAPRTAKPNSFRDGLLWAKYMGDASKLGYEVIFRQPKIKEFFLDTPAYWISVFHKYLMGRNVLDTRTPYLNKPNSHIYAHCTKRQNKYIRRGALTVFVVNMEPVDLTATVRVVGMQLKSIEVQSYILTAKDEDESELYLNGEKLEIDKLHKGKLDFTPKLRRARANRILTLALPPRSIGFFVLPNARLTACIHGEEEMSLLMEEIFEDQLDDWAKEETPNVENKNKTDFSELWKIMEEEMEEETAKSATKFQRTEEDNQTRTEFRDEKHHRKHLEKPNSIRHLLIERAKMAENIKKLLEADKMKTDIRQHLLDKIKKEKERQKKEEICNTSSSEKIELELSEDEVEKILRERALSRVLEKKLNVTSTEIDKITQRAAENLLNSHNQTVTVRDRRFIPLEMLKNCSAFHMLQQLMQKDSVAKQRQRRQIQFARKKIRSNDELKKHAVESNQQVKASLRIPRKMPSEDKDLLIQLNSIESDESDEKKEFYDYVSTDESFESFEPIETVEMKSPKFGKNGVFGKDKNSKLKLTDKPKNRSVISINSPDYVRKTQLPDEWLDVDGIGRYYYAPNEFFENFSVVNVNIRDDLRVYGELWEADEYVEVLEPENEEEELLATERIPDEKTENKTMQETKDRLNQYLKNVEHMKASDEMEDISVDSSEENVNDIQMQIKRSENEGKKQSNQFRNQNKQTTDLFKKYKRRLRRDVHPKHGLRELKHQIRSRRKQERQYRKENQGVDKHRLRDFRNRNKRHKRSIEGFPTTSGDNGNTDNSLEKFHFVIGKPYDPSKLVIDEKRKNRQLTMIRNRLNRQKKIDVKRNEKQVKPKPPNKLQKPISLIENILRRDNKLTEERHFQKIIPNKSNDLQKSKREATGVFHRNINRPIRNLQSSSEVHSFGHSTRMHHISHNKIGKPDFKRKPKHLIHKVKGHKIVITDSPGAKNLRNRFNKTLTRSKRMLHSDLFSEEINSLDNFQTEFKKDKIASNSEEDPYKLTIVNLPAAPVNKTDINITDSSGSKLKLINATTPNIENKNDEILHVREEDELLTATYEEYYDESNTESIKFENENDEMSDKFKSTDIIETVFQSMSGILNRFHKKVVDCLQYFGGS